jgi:Ca2+-binding EF-hand superfamily protein
VLKRAKISVKATFEEFDVNGDGDINKGEFIDALRKLRITDLSQMQVDALWNSLDSDHSGAIDYREFVRKLERYGVKSRAPHEDIIYQMIEAAHKARIKSMADFFKVIDAEGTGLVTRQNFKDIFNSLQLNVDNKALDNFVDSFWKHHQLGIDYKEFLRIFTRFEVRLSQDQKAIKSGTHITSDAVIRKKRSVYTRMKEEMDLTGVDLARLFAFVDADEGSEPGLDRGDIWTMFQKMGLADRLTKQESDEIFASIDFDNSGDISLPEFKADFDDYLARTENQIMMEMRAKQQMQEQEERYEKYGQDQFMNQYAGHDKEVVQQMRIDSLKEREKGLYKKIETQQRILANSEKSTADLMLTNDTLMKKDAARTVQAYDQKAELAVLRKQNENSCSKDEYHKLQEDKTKLITELTETRAAMLSYKSMCGVIGNQVKDMKLIHERRKDEQDNLFAALREMQAEDVGKERLGKLYYVIMLSRWQEAAVNKKYERALSEVKELRGQLLSSEMMLKATEGKYHETEHNLRNAALSEHTTKQKLDHLEATCMSQE